MRELPVEDAGHAVGADHQVAHPEIPVNEGPPVRRRAFCGQCTERELKRRVRLAEPVMPLAQQAQGVVDRRRQMRVDGHAMNGCQRSCDVIEERVRARDPIAGQDRLRVGRSREPLDNPPARSQRGIVRAVGEDRGHRHPGGGRGGEQLRFARCFIQLAGALFDLDDERSARRHLEGERLARGATAQPARFADDGLAEHLAEAVRHSLQAVLHGADSDNFRRGSADAV
jgi:hypothetical protein